MTTEVNLFSVPWTRKLFPLILNCVLENVLVCAQFSSQLAHGTSSLCFITQLVIYFGILLFFPHFYAQNCALRTLNIVLFKYGEAWRLHSVLERAVVTLWQRCDVF